MERTVLICDESVIAKDTEVDSRDDAKLFLLQSTYEVVTYTKRVRVKAGQYVQIPHDTDLILGFSGENGAVPKMNYRRCLEEEAPMEVLNTSDVAYLTPMPLSRMHYLGLFVSCDVDTTVSILFGVVSSRLFHDLRYHTFVLEDGRRYDADLRPLRRSDRKRV